MIVQALAAWLDLEPFPLLGFSSPLAHPHPKPEELPNVHKAQLGSRGGGGGGIK